MIWSVIEEVSDRSRYSDLYIPEANLLALCFHLVNSSQYSADDPSISPGSAKQCILGDLHPISIHLALSHVTFSRVTVAVA